MNVADLPEPYSTPSREEEFLEPDPLPGEEIARSAPARAASTAASTAGLAPAHRQCRYELANGHHCRRWAVRAHDFCQEHGRWMSTRVEGALEVPLLEDPAAVTHVLSQTVRALSWGRIPPSNARAIISACRALQIGFGHAIAHARLRLAEDKFRLKLHQLKLTLEDLSSRPAAEPAQPEAAPAEEPRLDPEDGALDTVDCALAPVNCELSPVDSEQAPVDPALDRLPCACDPCIAAIQEGADPARLDCDHCPAYIAGNLRAPQLPDPRNPPETPGGPGAPFKPDVGLSGVEGGPLKPDVGLSGVEGGTAIENPNFLHLKQKWDDDLWRAAKQQTSPRDQRLSTPEDRAHPFDEYLHTPPTAPPPPVPAEGAPTLESSAAA